MPGERDPPYAQNSGRAGFDVSICQAVESATDESTIAQFSQALKDRVGKLHLLMNCSDVLHAEGTQPDKQLKDVSAANLARSFAVNATAPLLIAKYMLLFPRYSGQAVFTNLSVRVDSIPDNQLGDVVQ